MTPDQLQTPLWTISAKPQMRGLRPIWCLLPEHLVVIGEGDVTAYYRTSGKIAYTAVVGDFARNTEVMLFDIGPDPQSKPVLYLVNDRTKNREAAILAKVDLTNGKFVWKTAIVTSAGRKFPPVRLDPKGIVSGYEDGVVFYFDPETGKPLAKLPPVNSNLAQPPPIASRVKTDRDTITLRDAGGKTLWMRNESGNKGTALLSVENVVIPLVNERTKTQVLSLNIKDGTELWRCPIPFDRFADQLDVRVEPAKNGYLVHLSWLVLD